MTLIQRVWVSARTKQYFWWMLLSLPIVIMVCWWTIRRLLTSPTIQSPSLEPFSESLGEIGQKISETNNIAFIQIAAARSGEQVLQEEVRATLEIPDGPTRRAALIALRKRISP